MSNFQTRLILVKLNLTYERVIYQIHRRFYDFSMEKLDKIGAQKQILDHHSTAYESICGIIMKMHNSVKTTTKRKGPLQYSCHVHKHKLKKSAYLFSLK